MSFFFHTVLDYGVTHNGIGSHENSTHTHFTVSNGTHESAVTNKTTSVTYGINLSFNDTTSSYDNGTIMTGSHTTDVTTTESELTRQQREVIQPIIPDTPVCIAPRKLFHVQYSRYVVLLIILTRLLQ